MVKNLSATWGTPIQSLSWEDPLEKGIATHSSSLAWRIPWTEEPEELQLMGSVRHNWATDTHTCTHLIRLWRLPELYWEFQSQKMIYLPKVLLLNFNKPHASAFEPGHLGNAVGELMWVWSWISLTLIGYQPVLPKAPRPLTCFQNASRMQDESQSPSHRNAECITMNKWKVWACLRAPDVCYSDSLWDNKGSDPLSHGLKSCNTFLL